MKQYDTILLKFSMGRLELDKVQYSVDWINEEYRYLLPIGMTPNADGIKKWLSERTIPKNREYVDRILAQSGLSHGDTMGIINLCKGLSLNDSYWVVEEGFDGKFGDYNLYQNNFTRTLALIAYTGYGSNTKRGFASSPEYTTNGMLRKCWRRISGKIYLYKGGTSGAANTGKEPYSEYYAAQIAAAMGIDHVDYGLAMWHDSLCSTCELFTDINTSYVPMHKFLSQGGLRETADYLKGVGSDYYDAFVDMLVFDALFLIQTGITATSGYWWTTEQTSRYDSPRCLTMAYPYSIMQWMMISRTCPPMPKLDLPPSTHPTKIWSMRSSRPNKKHGYVA